MERHIAIAKIKNKLLPERTNCDLDLIDESGQMVNLAEMSVKEKAYNLLKDDTTYYPLIIRKNTDGSLSNFDIYGKEEFSQEQISKLGLQIKKSVNKLSKKKAGAADNTETAETHPEGGQTAVQSSTGKARKKKSDKTAGESSS
ncbi:uncharacterized protein LOC142354233 isoform X2 [Convolutriloba macropyga]|uniref:uncharacterized protein LOC142354233 isoform X2 n=1 Tax=Convolutriloba macropyga TaxID=536237 RepID=UPI003F51B03F